MLNRLAMLALLCACARAEWASTWTLAQSQHFEVYSQAGGETARSALVWFEQLRAFFQQAGLNFDDRSRVRVIGFRSTKEYNLYRLRASSDAYYVGTESRDYIVMPTLAADHFRVAAHEYAHAMLHAAGLKFPPWLAEGLAEFFSTIRISGQGCELGAELPAHLQVLERRGWIPLGDLIAVPEKSPFLENRENASLFYAESWELTDMLVLSPNYAPRFHDLISALASGISGAEVLTSVYGKPLDTIVRDMQVWAGRRNSQPVRLRGVTVANAEVKTSELSPFASRFLIAEFLFNAGELDRAEALYGDLAREAPENGDVLAALGTIALSKGDRENGRQHWSRALQMGVDDAPLCFRYAILAEEAGMAADEIRPALERAVELKPSFDDARYKLALLENNAGHYEAALTQFHAMGSVAARRAYAYWSAIAYALEELGKREEAQAAAQRAAKHATTSSERANALQIAYIAQTDLAVQFTRDANGRTQLVTTRVSHGTSDWNPFIEPGDQIRSAEGQLRSIECGDNKVTGVSIEAGNEQLRLSIPDPLHVLMRNAPAQFTCGAQASNPVVVQFAVSKTPGSNIDGTLRGMKFR